MNAMILCAVKGSKEDASSEMHNSGIGMEETTCQGDCGRTIVYSSRTAEKVRELTAKGMNADLMCNQCGTPRVALASALTGTPVDLGILPGTLPGNSPYERRRRNELEARGFRDLDPGEQA